MSQQGASTALVLEGGGYRGVFTAGVLDVLMEQGVLGFSSVWGTSAGALNAASLKSRQPGRTIRIMLAFRDDRRMMSLSSLARTGSLAGGDFLYHTVQEELDPSDDEAFNANPLRMFVVATDVVFGAPAYLECRCFPEDVEKVKASASMPLVSPFVEIGGRRYLDGGTTDSIPVEVALGLPGAPRVAGYEPASRAVVVLTQHDSYRRTSATERLVIHSHRYDEYPYYLEALETRAQRYNAQRRHVLELEREGRVVALSPSEPVTVGVNENEGGPLLALYVDGRRQALRRLEQIRTLLAGS